MNFLCQLEVEISANCFFTAAILKIKNGGHTGICANVNIGFQIPDAISFQKIC